MDLFLNNEYNSFLIVMDIVSLLFRFTLSDFFVFSTKIRCEFKDAICIQKTWPNFLDRIYVVLKCRLLLKENYNNQKLYHCLKEKHNSAIQQKNIIRKRK